jgi:hypothetical protein
MKEAKVVKPTKEILGIEPKVGDEWDAGNLPFGCAYRRVRVTVRKDADDKWTVFCVAYRGAEKLLGDYRVTISMFDCETCAKALALCLVFGSDYAACVFHDRENIADDLLLDGTLLMLLATMGLRDLHSIDEGSVHRILWVARQILDGELNWQKVISAWERTEAKGRPLNAAIRDWDAEWRWS